MIIMTFQTVICILFISTSVTSQSNMISESLNKFGINLLKETVNEAGDTLNVALSPFTVWALLSMVAEGARGSTLQQLDDALMLPVHNDALRNDIEKLLRNLTMKTESSEVDFNMAFFHDEDVTVRTSFIDVVKRVYQVDPKAVDFKDTKKAHRLVNNYVAQKTRGRIPTLINEDDVRDAFAFITSVLFFKGQWGAPFNKSSTHKEKFYDEKGNQIGEVDMMYQTGIFGYSRVDAINAFALELPYGHDDKMAMIVLVPAKEVSVSRVLDLLSQKSLSVVIDALEKSKKEYADEDVYVYLPKFTIKSDLVLNIVLNKMGIRDVFDQNKVDLLGMFDHYYPLSRFLQRAEIEVDEEGTIASAAAGAAFPNKSYPPKFKANRPFLFFIINKQTNSVIFSGKYSNPNSLQ